VVNTVTTVGATFSMMGAKLVIAPCGACTGSCAGDENAPGQTKIIVSTTRDRKILRIKVPCPSKESPLALSWFLLKANGNRALLTTESSRFYDTTGEN